VSDCLLIGFSSLLPLLPSKHYNYLCIHSHQVNTPGIVESKSSFAFTLGPTSFFARPIHLRHRHHPCIEHRVPVPVPHIVLNETKCKISFFHGGLDWRRHSRYFVRILPNLIYAPYLSHRYFVLLSTSIPLVPFLFLFLQQKGTRERC
jgi:hypothetical protein